MRLPRRTRGHKESFSDPHLHGHRQRKAAQGESVITSELYCDMRDGHTGHGKQPCATPSMQQRAAFFLEDLPKAPLFVDHFHRAEHSICNHSRFRQRRTP
ncbi:hypothetical protein NX059_007441 [Plenodomus lindquistii]|nr:hypothetical protein NX059_007441 [Plenodomus lindquistii]